MVYNMTTFFLRALASGMHIMQTFHPQGLHMVKSRNWDGIAKKNVFQMSNDEIRAIIDRDEKCICR